MAFEALYKNLTSPILNNKKGVALKEYGEWDDKFCIVTGAASGIGASTVNLLSKMGARVLAVDINAAKLSETTDEIGAEGAIVIARTCDVSNEESVKNLYREFESEKLSVLFNIAALPSPGIPIEKLSSQLWDTIMSVNVKSVFLMSKYAIPLFKNNSQGVIVNTSSVHAYASMRNMTAYAASKGALVSMTSQLSLDLVDYRVRVVGVAPGSVNTPMTTMNLREDTKKLNKLGFATDGYSIGHVGEPSEISEALLWVASSKASFVNGTTITVDGGLLARLVNTVI